MQVPVKFFEDIRIEEELKHESPAKGIPMIHIELQLLFCISLLKHSGNLVFRMNQGQYSFGEKAEIAFEFSLKDDARLQDFFV